MVLNSYPFLSPPLSSLTSWDMVYACWNIVGEYYQDFMQRTQSIHIVAIIIIILCSFFNYCTVLTVSGMHFIIALHYTSLSKSSALHNTSLHAAVSRGKTYTQRTILVALHLTTISPFLLNHIRHEYTTVYRTL